MTRSSKKEIWQRLATIGQTRILLLILTIYLGLAVLYTLYTPPFEGPDEPQHFAYISWLIRTGSLPPQGERATETGIEQESSQHPLYYFLASLPARLVNMDEPAIVFRPNPNFVGPLPREYPDNDNRAIHYPGDAKPLAGGWLALYLARAVTMAFGLLLIVAVYGLGREVAPLQPRFALRAASLVAVIPQTIFLGSVVSNDIPVAALGGVTLWALAHLVRHGYSLRPALWLGAALGLAILTKVSALALLAPVGLGLLWLLRRERQTARQFLTMSAAVAGTALLLSGWWFIRGWLLYGSPLGLETHDATSWAIVDPQDVDEAWRRWWEVFRSFWIWLGWGTVRPDVRLYRVLFILALLALVGLALALWRRWRREHRRLLLALGSQLMLLNLIALASTALTLEVWMRRVVAPYGRLLYPALGAVVVLLVAGWSSIERRFPLIPITFLFFVAVLMPEQVMRPAYAPPQPLSEEEVAAFNPSLRLRFGPTSEEAFAELWEVRVLENSVPVGGLIPVRVCWHTLRRAERDYSLLLQVIGPENRFIAGRRTYPGLGTYPTSQWEPDQVFCERVQIATQEKLQVEPLVYQLEVGMIDSETNKRVPIFDEAGNEWPVAFVDRVHVYSESLTRSVAADEVSGGSALQLLDYAVPNRHWQSGASNTFSLYWVAATPVDRDYQTFVHLRATPEAIPVAQADGAPLGGWFPTSWWPVDQVIVDERTFSVPAETPEGTYGLYVGLYDLSDGQRGSPEYHLGQITVGP
ncbi:MAG TPA: hypothetical protein VE553_04440 [Candidatus Binatia bacterium]|nr:hypothetical protein [Candidatus Binatia bacterium]